MIDRSKLTVMLVVVFCTALMFGVTAIGGAASGPLGNLVLATTTSTYDSGLLHILNPVFTDLFGMRVKVISVGTGAALELGRRGDVDLVLVHARTAEDRFMEEGYGINRRDVMFNDFIIVGPADDPAMIYGMLNVTDALQQIAMHEVLFLSRGDRSGTHIRERFLWAEAGIEPIGRWYQESGRGMGDTLVQASLMGAHTLVDRGTWLAMRERLDLVVLVEGPLRGGDVRLANPYGILAINPAIHPHVNYIMAMAYIGFITSPLGQELIAGFKRNGEQLFFPAALQRGPNFAQFIPEECRGDDDRD
ncbi:substrate-binding domain-containing protein [Candidatus Acetothermia bacterium]|nr:substrate-binding domain-containing protein [Candidatus Acetothermia bacterium]